MADPPTESLEPPRLWNMDDLAAYMRMSPQTVRTLLSRAPERLPPRLANIARPLWEPSVVRMWAIERSRPSRSAAGRKRANG